MIYIYIYPGYDSLAINICQCNLGNSWKFIVMLGAIAPQNVDRFYGALPQNAFQIGEICYNLPRSFSFLTVEWDLQNIKVFPLTSNSQPTCRSKFLMIDTWGKPCRPSNLPKSMTLENMTWIHECDVYSNSPTNQVGFTLDEINIAPENGPSTQKETKVFQPSIFRCYCWWKKSCTSW